MSDFENSEERFEVPFSVFDDYVGGRRDRVNPKTRHRLDQLFKEFGEIRLYSMIGDRIIFDPEAERELRKRELVDPELQREREVRERELKSLLREADLSPEKRRGYEKELERLRQRKKKWKRKV